MERWVLFALTATLMWGLGSFFGKIALMRDVPYRVYFFEGIGTITVLTSLIIFKRQEIFNGFAINPYALLMGLTWGIGTIIFIIALQPAKLSALVPLTAVYPAVTVILGVLVLHERLDLREILGIVFAIITVVLLSK
jgi:bacterial/archaeal transporter family protein